MVYIHSLGTRSTTPFNCFTYIPHPGVVNQYRINQAIPSVPNTSDNYWLPYSAAGDTPTLTALPTAASDTNLDVGTTAQEVMMSSDIPTTSLIQITALPPATTSPQAVLPKLPYHRQVNILFLIPLFIALGVVLGAITAVISLKWRKNQRRSLRTPTLLPGPPYVPPENDVENRLLVHGHPSMEQVSLFAASTPSKFTVHGSRYIPKRILAWQTLDTTRPPYSQPTYTQTIIPSSDGERFTVVTQEDPFLVPSPSNPMAMRESPITSNDVSLPTIRILPSLPEPISGDESNHHQAQDTNLRKPFRRSMFDILKLKSPYRPIPSLHNGYTVLVPDDESADKASTSRVRRVSSLKECSLAGGSRFRSARRSLDGGFYVGETKDALGLLGFQDDKQDLVDDTVVLPKSSLRLQDGMSSSPTQGKNMRKPREVTPFAAESKGSPKEGMYGEKQSINERRKNEINSDTHPDIYTVAPQRRPFRSPHKKIYLSDVSRRSSAPDMHASVLPLSPPSLMSPPLEKSLFFTSSLSSSASLAAHMNSLVSIDASPLHHVERSPEFSLFPLPSKKTKATKKLRTSRPEPPLPYPPYPDHGHAQPTPRKRSTSCDTKRRSVSPGSPNAKGRSTNATRRESMMGISSLGSLSPTSLMIALASSSSSDMLSKVNDIVAQGYTKRRTSMEGWSEDVGASLPDPI